MAKKNMMTFVQARAMLSEIVDRVAEHDEAYVVAKRQKPVAVIIGLDRSRHWSGTAKYLKAVSGKRILKIGGIAKASEDMDRAIRELRKSRVEGAGQSL